MFTEERQQKITEILKDKNSVTISELEKEFSVSNETIRRDLLSLERSKKLIRVHGGAMRIDGNFSDKSFNVRHTENTAEKDELVKQAMGFINDGDIISIDCGSTAVFFCETLIKNFKNLTVITNSLMLFNILSQNKGFRIILCSGEYDRESEAFLGFLTSESIKKIHISKSFLCPSGISLKNGLTDFSESFINIQKAYKESSDKCFVMADSSKFELAGLYTVTELCSDITVITDSNLSDEIYERYINADIDIVRGNKND